MTGPRLFPLFLLVSAPVAILHAAPSIVVDWGGDYVSSHAVHDHTSYDGTGSDDWEVATAGAQGFATRAFDASPDRALTPASGYTPPSGKSAAFYGGYSGALNLGPAIPGGADGLTSGYRDVEQNGSADRIVVQSGGNAAKVRGAIVFLKDDFLGSSSSRTVTLGAASRLLFSGALDGWRAEARWLVRDGGTWYISQATLAPQVAYDTAEDRTLAPNSTQWAVCELSTAGGGGSYFSPAPSTFAAHTFQDVTGAGIFFDSFGAASFLGGSSFSRLALERFRVTADTAEPTAAVNWGGNYVSTSQVHANTVFDGTGSDDWEISTAGTQGFASRLFDAATARALTPAAGYLAPSGRSSAFFGGYSGALNTGPAIPGGADGVTSGYRYVEQNGSADRIVFQGAGNAAKIRGAVVFRKDEFLRQSHHTPVSFDSASQLAFSGVLDGWRPEARWMVREGATWYISKATLTAQSTYNAAETRTLSPHATQWAAFDPSTAGTGGSHFTPAPSSFAARAFTDVTAAGVFFDSFNASATLGGSSFSRFGLEQFQVRAKIHEPPVTVLSTNVINDTIPDEVFPSSMAKAANGDLILAFSNKGDIPPGCSGYLIRSTDQGATWSAPIHTFQSTDPKVGTMPTIATLPDGSLLLSLIECIHPAYPSISHRYTHIEMMRSTDNGASFQSLAALPLPLTSLSSIMGVVCQFPNGDLALPAYVHQGEYTKDLAFDYGCGFFRSTDGGISWGFMEVAFQDPPAGVPTALEFTEAAFVVGTDSDSNPLNDPIIAIARIDTDPTGQYSGGTPHSLWKTVSTDNGVTWSTPEPIGISGIYPAALRAGSHSYLMVCGDRQASPSRRVSFYTSRDAENYAFRGHPPTVPYNSATGGGQAIVELSPGIFYVAYYSSRLTPDPYDSPTAYEIYLEGCKIQVGDPAAPFESTSHSTGGGSGPGDTGEPSEPEIPPVQLTEASSLREHGQAGEFSIPLSLGSAAEDAVAVECRKGDELTIALTFDRAPTALVARLISGDAQLNEEILQEGRKATLRLSEVANQQTIRIALSEKVTSKPPVAIGTIELQMLAGDVNGDGTVTSADGKAARSAIDQKATAENFRSDFDADGTITPADIVNIRGASR